MKNKILISIFILLFIFSTVVFATNVNTDVEPKKVDSDLYVEENKTYILDSNVSGNVFAFAENFEMQDTAILKGNLYIMADKVLIKSNVTYSNATAKDGSKSIDMVNSYASIKGNVFVMCDEFTLEPGCEITGDLYILANKIDIQKSSTIAGNVFAVSREMILNGRIGNSVYASTNKFTMEYYGSISSDLNLASEDVLLNSVIHRNAYITSNTINTNSDFLLYGNLEVENGNEFNFSGKVDGNANINVKKLNFVQDPNITCEIEGNLNYSTKEELKGIDGIVEGTINYSEYVDKAKENTFNFMNFVVDLITFVVYVLVVAVIFNLINKNYSNNKHEITVKNTLYNLGIGLLSIIVVAVVAIVLMLLSIGTTLSLTVLFAYIFLLFLSIPLFVLDIAILLKDKLNIYVTIPLIALGLAIVAQIPYVGGLVMFLFMMTGIGRITGKVLFKKN